MEGSCWRKIRAIVERYTHPEADRLPVVASHVETIALLSKKNLKPKDYVEISVDAEDYDRIKDAKK